MASTLEEQLGVATGGVHWDVGAFQLWQSTVPEILFYSARELQLARETGRRYRASLTQVRRFGDDGYDIIGGAAVLGVFGDPSGADLTALADNWRRVLLNTGYRASPRPRFLPLPTRNVQVSAALDASHVTDVAAATASREGRTLTLNLTASGARAWTQAMHGEAAVKGTVRIAYEYPQLLPRSIAAVSINGTRAHALASTELRKAADGTLFGSPGEIGDLWDVFVRDGALRITLVEAADVEGDRQALLTRLSELAREQLFETLFERYAPDPMLALRWKTPADAIDFTISVAVEGWTWLKSSLVAELGGLLAALDDSYLHTTYESVSVPVSLVVEPAPAVTSVALSIDFGSAHAPEAPIFDSGGGTRQFTISSDRPDTVTISHRATVNFSMPNWPVIETSGSSRLGHASRIALQPQSWVRRHTMYLYVRRGDRIVPQLELDSADYLTVTATYTAKYLSQPIRASLRITPGAPVEFTYPVPPNTPLGEAKVTLMGVIGGKMVNSAEIALDESDEAIYFLVEGTRVQSVARNVVVSESDALAERLRSSHGRPTISQGAPIVAETSRELDVQTDVVLIPQPTDVTCWAASLAMVVSARDQMSTDPARIASVAGMDIHTGYGWDAIRRAVRTWSLVEEGPQSAMPEDVARWLENWGPIWVVEIGAPYHAVVLSGITGDGTSEGTYVTVYNPWPPGVGAIETKWFIDFENEFGLGAGAGAAMVHAATE
jgi:hypothetical protein